MWPGANDTAAPDSDAYLLARVTKLSKIGDDALVFPAPDDFDPYNPGAFSLIGNREITLALQGFRPGSLDALEDLRTSLDLPGVLDALANADTDNTDLYASRAALAYVDAKPIQNLNGLSDASADERWLLEIRFRANSEVTPGDGLDVIESVSGTGTMNPDTDDLTLTLNAADPG